MLLPVLGQPRLNQYTAVAMTTTIMKPMAQASTWLSCLRVFRELLIGIVSCDFVGRWFQ
jgi:hypothetical protein